MSKTIVERVAEAVRVEAARRKLPQSAIAEYLGTSQQTVSRRLSGESPFEVDEIYVLAAAFGMSVASLLPEAYINRGIQTYRDTSVALANTA